MVLACPERKHEVEIDDSWDFERALLQLLQSTGRKIPAAKPGRMGRPPRTPCLQFAASCCCGRPWYLWAEGMSSGTHAITTACHARYLNHSEKLQINPLPLCRPAPRVFYCCPSPQYLGACHVKSAAIAKTLVGFGERGPSAFDGADQIC